MQIVDCNSFFISNYNGNGNSGKLINSIGYFAALPGLPTIVGAVGLSLSTLSYMGSMFGSGRNLVDFFASVDASTVGNFVVLEVRETFIADNPQMYPTVVKWKVLQNFPADIKSKSANPRIALASTSAECDRYIRSNGGNIYENERVKIEYPGKYVQFGQGGVAVAYVQSAINRKKISGINAGTVDGIWGGGTDNAVRAFQRYYGLSADGIVGPSTWNKL